MPADPAEEGASSKWRRAVSRQRGAMSNRCPGLLVAAPARPRSGEGVWSSSAMEVTSPFALGALFCSVSSSGAPPLPGTHPVPPHAVSRMPPTAGVLWLGTSPSSSSARIAAEPRLGRRRAPSPASVCRCSLPAPAAPAGHASPRRLWWAAASAPRSVFSASVVCVSATFLVPAPSAVAPALGVWLPQLPNLCLLPKT